LFLVFYFAVYGDYRLQAPVCRHYKLIDPSIPENLAILAMYLAIPEIDNMRRSSKIKSGIRTALKAGRWCWKAPVGYKNTRDEENKPVIILSEKADSIRYLFEEISAG